MCSKAKFALTPSIASLTGAVQQSTVRLHARERLWESQKATGRVIELLPRERIESRDWMGVKCNDLSDQSKTQWPSGEQQC